MNKNTAVNWPAIIKHANDEELIYVRDLAEWDGDADLHAAVYDEADLLIDVTGQLYGLTTRLSRHVIPTARHASMPLLDILGLIKAHAAETGSCCVAKLYAPTIQDAFTMLASLKED